VIVSRGQLIEIGGSFRLPEIFSASGARLREVGTTNRTRLADYKAAIGPDTAALLRVHPSNYRIVGFTESVSIDALAGLAKEHGLWTIDDLGSGALAAGLLPVEHDEPTFAASMAAGADVVLASGDKLLGGPQCGIIAGRREAVQRVKSDPLMRALRVDKLTLAALEATLRLALNAAVVGKQIPLWNFLSIPLVTLEIRAKRVAESLRAVGLNATTEVGESYLGGGSAPARPLPTFVVRVSRPFPVSIPGEAIWAASLRVGVPSVVPRVQGGALLFDLRAIPAHEDSVLCEAIARTSTSVHSCASPKDIESPPM
jgi:L-seryl-tRNA(Ser) seleniumtransferase